MATTSQRFNFAYGSIRPLMTLMGLGPGLSRIEVRPDTVVVRMGWGFRASIPRSAISGAREEAMSGHLGIGVHGWRGKWLVNGSMSGIVTIEVDPPCRATVMTAFPVSLKTLQVSAEDPAGLVAAIGRR
jgi:hypothetical protein